MAKRVATSVPRAVRRTAVRLVVLATLATVVALPVRAFAAILPACEVELATIHVPPPEPACEVVTVVDEMGETSAAPICDARGASAVAPPRILPVSDARIEASPCGPETTELVAAPNRNDGPSSSVDTSPAHPALPTSALDLPSPPPIEQSFAPPNVVDGARAGHARGLERPPR